jgi:serine/threonine protein kinase/WD40 repeat protein
MRCLYPFLFQAPRIFEKRLRETGAFFALLARAKLKPVEANMSERDLFIAALQITDPVERSAWLDRECGGDASLRQRIDVLLEAFDQAGSVLENPVVAVAPTIDEPMTERPGMHIGPYKLLERIGEGGMGTVWMAEQTEPIQRRVAVKVVKEGMDTRQVLARFEAERQALALMEHPNIARVLDAGKTLSGRPFFAMELVKGKPITAYCDEKRLPVRERLELFGDVCRAVQHAHQKGIIHRDLKPSNVLVAPYDGKPVVKVIDFGVAKATGPRLTDKTLFTGFGALVGTPEYMSPEQAEVNNQDIDTRSDIYSLGVLLYELLTGSTPLTRQRVKEAALLEVLRVIRDEEPPKPSTRLSESKDSLPSISAQRRTEPARLTKLVRGELEWIVMKALEKDRNRRYETANGLAMDVQRYLADEAVLACPPSATYRLWKFVRRNKVVLATTALVTVSLVAGTVISLWQAIRATEAEGKALTSLQAETEARNATREQLQLTQAAEEEARKRLYHSLVDQAKARRLSQRMGQRFDTLATLREAARMARTMRLPEEEFLKLRNEAIACLAIPDLRVAREWAGFPTGSWSVDFADGLERYARVDRQGAVSVRRVADDAEICSLAGIGPGKSEAVFSSDGQFLAVWRLNDEQYQVWKLIDQAPAKLLQGRMYTFAFSPDSRRLATALPDGSIHLYDLPSGRETKQLTSGPRAHNLAFHPKDQRLAVSSASGIQIRDLKTGLVVAELAQPNVGYCLAWDPSGKTLAVAGTDGTIHIWDVAARKPVVRLEGHRNYGIKFAFNHAGNLLVSTCWDGLLRIWDPSTGQQLFKTPCGGVGVRFSLDDRFLVAEIFGDKLRMFEIASLQAYRTLVRDPALGRGDYYSSAIHPDGRMLAVGMADGMGFWDLVNCNHLASIRLAPGLTYLHFEPSGALLSNGPDGLYRWPVRDGPASGELRRVGPPQELPLPGSQCHLAQSKDGRVLASPQFNGALVLHRDHPGQPVRLGPHEDVRYVAVSPDGRLVATCSHSGTKVRVWQALSGKLEKELPIEVSWWVGFSPDGKWLATSLAGCRLWAVEGWQPGPKIDGAEFAFSPDSKLLALETGSGVVRLVEPNSGREYARLEDPNQDRANSIGFIPDGTRLLTTNNDSHSIHVWDLHAIRAELAKMDLDWELPPYPPERLEKATLRVRVELGDVRSHALARIKNNEAWPLLTAGDVKLRDPHQAVELAREAVQLAPEEGNYWNTLGVAHYRVGEWNAAIDALQKSMSLRKGGDALDYFFLALAHLRLDHKDEAHQWFQKGVEWVQKNKNALDKDKLHHEELHRFRADVEQLIGLKR